MSVNVSRLKIYVVAVYTISMKVEYKFGAFKINTPNISIRNFLRIKWFLIDELFIS